MSTARFGPPSVANRKNSPFSFAAIASPVYADPSFERSAIIVAWLVDVCVVGSGTIPSKAGLHALIVPSSVAKIKNDFADLPFSVTTKSVAFGLMFPTVPVGVPKLPDPLFGDGGMLTNSGICCPAPVYSVENPEPLSLNQNGVAASAVNPHELIKCCWSVDGAAPCTFDARSVRTY